MSKDIYPQINILRRYGHKPISWVIILLCLLCSSTPVGAQTVDIVNVWAEFDVDNNGEHGMKIHTRANVHGVVGTRFHLAFLHYFEFSDGRPVPANTKYSYSVAPQGIAQTTTWVGWDVDVNQDPVEIYDWWIFLSYDAFQVSPGDYDMCIYTFAKNDSEDKFIQNNVFKLNFHYNKPAPSTPNHEVKTPQYLPCISCGGTRECTFCGGKGITYFGHPASYAPHATARASARFATARASATLSINRRVN